MVYHTSEDPGHQASSVTQLLREDEVPHEVSSYWLSKSHCEYPQVLICSFSDEVHLKQIQLLVHEYCIASHVELFSSMSASLDSNRGGEFRRLGHLSLDPNIKSDYQSRELKTIIIDSTLTALKLVFHKPHTNHLNTQLQVGLVQIECMGTRLIPPQMTVLINDIENKKRNAIAMEDFDEAKQLKAKIESIKTSGDASLLDKIQSLPIDTVADSLPAYFEREHPHIIASITKQTAILILSRDWRLREKGLVDITKNLSNFPDPITGACWAIKQLLNDKIVNVYVAVMSLMQAVIDMVPTINEDDEKVSLMGLSEILDISIRHMIDIRLSDYNKRISDSTIVTLVSISKNLDKKNFPAASLITQILVRDHSTTSNRLITGRCILLVTLIDSIGFKTKKNAQGIPLEPLLKITGTWLNNTTGETKTSCLHVLHAILRIVERPKFDQLIETFPQLIRDNLLYEADRVRGVVAPSSSGAAVVSIACEFCGTRNPQFIQTNQMDRHYWEECAALIECRFCEQIVEITGLTEHRLKECTGVDPFSNIF